MDVRYIHVVCQNILYILGLCAEYIGYSDTHILILCAEYIGYSNIQCILHRVPEYGGQNILYKKWFKKDVCYHLKEFV